MQFDDKYFSLSFVTIPNELVVIKLNEYIGYIISLILLWCTQEVYAQSSDNRFVFKTLASDSIDIPNSESFYPSSLEVYDNNGMQITDSLMWIDPKFRYIKFNHLNEFQQNVDSITISLRKLQFPFDSIQYALYNKEKNKIVFASDPFKSTESLQNGPSYDDQLYKQGSISRGVFVGNNRDLSIQSDLNLQISGRLLNDINLTALISDDNIPIQPDGNTQQLQEFDQVFIQLENDAFSLSAGDFQFTSTSSGFLKFNKKVQGGRVSLNKQTDDSKVATTVSGAVSRGKFARKLIQGVEGNQGPYQLSGADNERFIIVLSGTERVFIDGMLLERGRDQDYIIDYNTGEITFTSQRLITKDKRIVVEFLYTSQNYPRSLFHYSQEYDWEKVRLFYHVYSEQDGKNQPLFMEFDDEDKMILEQTGDNASSALTNGIDSVGYNENLMLYRFVDTLGYDSVLVFSKNPEQALYKVRFSYIGPGNGDYYRDLNSGANGKVYKWAPPDTVNGQIIKKGEYLPVINLPLPERQRMYTIGGEYKLGEYTKVLVEGALSEYDRNTFSPEDSEDDMSFGIRSELNDDRPICMFGNSMHLNSKASYFNSRENFKMVERFLPVEFYRNWNLKSDFNSGKMDHFSSSSRIKFSNTDHIKVNFDHLNIPNVLSGDELGTEIQLRPKYLDVYQKASLVKTADSIRTSKFIRSKGRHAVNSGSVVPGIKHDFEYNPFREINSDSLLNEAYAYLDWLAFIETSDSTNHKVGLGYGARTDYRPKGESLVLGAVGTNINGYFQLNNQGRNNIKSNITYRRVEFDSIVLVGKNDQHILGRTDVTLDLFKSAIKSSFYYEIGQGLENKREFSFIEVPAGQGTHAWIDYNDNDIKELNEFEISVYTDQAKFIKVYTPTSLYVKVYSTKFGQNINFTPGKLFKKKQNVEKFVSKFQDQFSYKMNRKISGFSINDVYNPFADPDLIEDTLLVNNRSSIRNSIFFQRNSSVFSVVYNIQKSETRNLLVNGIDSRINDMQEMRVRFRIYESWNMIISGKKAGKNFASQFFTTRNFSVIENSVRPELSFQPSPMLRISVFGEYNEQKNHVDLGGEEGEKKEGGSEVKFSVPEKAMISMEAKGVFHKFTGEPQSSVGYEMLQGLQPGMNLVWNIGVRRMLSNNIQINVRYDGRKSEDSKTIHTGMAEVRALF